MASFGPNAGNVTYDVTANGLPNLGTSNVSIHGGPSGTTTLPIVPNGNIATTNGTTLTLVSLLGTSNYVVPPTVSANVVMVANALGTTNVYVGGTATLSTTVSLLSNTNINVTGGSATLANGLNVSALNGITVNLTDGGSFTNGNNLSSILDGMTIHYGTGGGTFVVNGGGTLINLSNTTITGFDQNNGLNNLEFQNTSAAAATYTISGAPGGTQTITVRDASNNVIATVNVANTNYTPGTYTPGDPGPLTVGNNGTTLTVTDQAVPCFLAGTRIRTAAGEVAIEDIRVGDDVFVSVDGKDELRPVTWIGMGHVLSNPNRPLDVGGYPVRILKDAVAEGVPYKDLLVTAEHSFHFDGRLVPIRMLVNGRSIFYDRSFQTYTYYHIEFAEHALIHADGMLSESYLDTGNRKDFAEHRGVLAFPGRAKDWAKDAAAPLCVDRAFVEPIFRTLEARAVLRNDPMQAEPAVLTREADLHLVTERGRIIRQARVADGMALFMIPSNVRSVRIVSRASRPADTIGPFVDDRRFLGVLVGSVTLQDGNVRRAIDTHLTAGSLRGWSVSDGGPCRWTDGDALLPLGARSPNAIAMLGLQILSDGPYLAEAADARHAALNG